MAQKHVSLRMGLGFRGAGRELRVRETNGKSSGDVPASLGCALAVIVMWFAVTWCFGFGMTDEGFYWYDTQRMPEGDVPLRDFMSYDIARYYWVAWLIYLMGSEGLYPARLADMAFQAVGMGVGVHLCLLCWRGHGAARYVYGIVVALAIKIRDLSHYKSYDHAASLMAVGALFMILERKDTLGWVLAGVVFGVAAMMARNHDLYAVVAASLVLIVGARNGMIGAFWRRA